MSRTLPLREWPLALFTVAIQLACGLAAVTTVAAFVAPAPVLAEMRVLGIATCPVVMLGLLCSALHLGRPLAAWRSLLNLGSSRLSLEVLLTAFFALAALAHSVTWWTLDTQAVRATGLIASLFGMAAVVCSAWVYLLPTKPRWNSFLLPASFVGSAFLLGGCASLICVRSHATFGATVSLTCAGALLTLPFAIWTLNSTRAARPQRADAHRLAICVVFAAIVPAMLAISGPGVAKTIQFAVFGSALVATFVGRMWMYALGTATPEF